MFSVLQWLVGVGSGCVEGRAKGLLPSPIHSPDHGSCVCPEPRTIFRLWGQGKAKGMWGSRSARKGRTDTHVADPGVVNREGRVSTVREIHNSKADGLMWVQHVYKRY